MSKLYEVRAVREVDGRLATARSLKANKQDAERARDVFRNMGYKASIRVVRC